VDISVVIPTYNRYTLLKRALESVYIQSSLPKEVIVVDDGSDDATHKIQNEFPQIQYIYQENRGVSAARNTGLKNASCEWIAFLDSDDLWHQEKLAKHQAYHTLHPKLLMSYTDESWIRNDQEIKVPKKYQKVEEGIFENSLSHCIIAPSSVCIHQSVFEKVGLFDEDLEVCEDYDLWLRIASEYQIGLIKEKLIQKYAGHPEQLSFKHWGMDRFRVQALEKLLHLHPKHPYREKIISTLVEKYTLLLYGAKKYNKTQSIKIYEEKIEEFSIF
jgi:glycosyltransferase involved in cell wall biosynthesis